MLRYKILKWFHLKYDTIDWNFQLMQVFTRLILFYWTSIGNIKTNDIFLLILTEHKKLFNDTIIKLVVYSISIKLAFILCYRFVCPV